MLTLGRNITTPGDPLQKVNLEQVFAAIVNSRSTLPVTIEALRSLKELDPRKYASQKTFLPYIAVGNYHPPIRRKENFSFSEHVIIDLDHLSEKGLNPHSLKAKLRADQRVGITFVSPGGDGLKVIFTLSEKIFDAAYYTEFYKRFASSFANEHGLSTVIDLKTKDVTRACFMSYDAEAYFNPAHNKINPEEFLSKEQGVIENKGQQRALEDWKETEKRIEEDKKEKSVQVLSDDVLSKIKTQLNPDFKPRLPKNIYEPPEINAILETLSEKLLEYELKLIESEPINYGRKLRIQLGNIWAEVNLFYGKKGFTVVKTTKTGSNADLAELVYQKLYQIIYG